jgi:hypothetical protein
MIGIDGMNGRDSKYFSTSFNILGRADDSLGLCNYGQLGAKKSLSRLSSY